MGHETRPTVHPRLFQVDATPPSGYCGGRKGLVPGHGPQRRHPRVTAERSLRKLGAMPKLGILLVARLGCMGLFTPLVPQPHVAARPRQTSAPWPQGLPSSATPASAGCAAGFSMYHSFCESSARVSPQPCRVCWLAAGRRPSLSRERETRSQCARPMPSRSSTSVRRRGCTASWDCRSQ